MVQSSPGKGVTCTARKQDGKQDEPKDDIFCWSSKGWCCLWKTIVSPNKTGC